MRKAFRVKVRHACLLAIAVGPFFAAATAGSEAAKPAGVPAGAADILGLESYWRWFISLRKPIIPTLSLRAAGQEAAGPKLLTGREVPPPYGEVDHQDSPPPPAAWEQPGFEDFGWPRSRLSWLRETAFSRFSAASLCLRGKFQVTDPAAVEGLYLTVNTTAGCGFPERPGDRPRALARRRAGRRHAGRDVPNDVYVGSNGQIVPMGDREYGWNSIPPQVRKDAEARVARRTRSLGPLNSRPRRCGRARTCSPSRFAAANIRRWPRCGSRARRAEPSRSGCR